MKHLIPVVICIFATIDLSFGQENPFFGMYMYSKSFYNPACVANQSTAHFQLQIRTQWLGYSPTIEQGGAPNTQMAGFEVPIKKLITGTGVLMVSDQTGPINRLIVQIPISKKVSFLKGTLSFGVAPSLVHYRQSPDWRYREPDDPLISSKTEFQSIPNFSLGIYFQSKSKYFYGFSMMNIFNPNFDFGYSSPINRVPRDYNFLFGRVFSFSRNIEVRPSLVLRSNFIGYTYNISCNFEVSELILGGVSFRNQEAVAFNVGSKLMKDKFLLIYSMEFIVNNQKAKSATSHEICMRYALPSLMLGGKKPIGTPRHTIK